MIRNPRVVITGMGVLAANGIGLPAFWNSLIKAQSGIGPITLFDASEHVLRIAGEVKNFQLSDYVNGHFKTKRMSRHTQFAVAATQMALDNAKLEVGAVRELSHIAINMGVSTSAIEIIERCNEMVSTRGPGRVSPYLLGASQPNDIVSVLGEYLDITSRTTLSTACAAGIEAIAYSAKQIREGRADVAITGGADAPINALTVASFDASGMVPDEIDDISTASRPFDLHRKGGILAEGAVVFVLENLSHALARGAVPLAEILGHGYWADSNHLLPCEGLSLAMESALANAGLLCKQVDYINAHGPSDRYLDKVETDQIKKCMARRAYDIPISSIKGCTGSPLSAAGPAQLAATVMGMQHGLIPPTANLETPDPECDLDYTPGKPYHVDFDRALINVHGMGGSNNCLAVGKVFSA